MIKEKFEELKTEAREAGENDTHTENTLIEGAQYYIDEITEELTDEEHDELIEQYRLGFLGERTPQPVIDALQKISEGISWDNWEVEEDEETGERNSGSTGQYWKVCEVMHCKLEWMREALDPENDDHFEHSDTIDQLQNLLAVLKAYEPSDF